MAGSSALRPPRRGAGWRAALLGLLGAAALAAGGCGARGDLAGPRETGTIRILSDPQGAAIDFDGVSRGETYDGKPLVLKGVPYGWHNVRASLPGRVPRVVEIDIGQPETEVRIPLSQEGYGRLAIHVHPPGAEVFIDSRYYGKAEPKVEVNTLSFGEHLLWVRLKGYRQERQNILVERQVDRAYHLFLKKEE